MQWPVSFPKYKVAYIINYKLVVIIPEFLLQVVNVKVGKGRVTQLRFIIIFLNTKTQPKHHNDQNFELSVAYLINTLQ